MDAITFDKSLHDKILHHLFKTFDAMLVEQLKFAIPQIRGKVTVGKLKWRGLKLVSHNNSYWIEQRGNRIGNVFTLMQVYPSPF